MRARVKIQGSAVFAALVVVAAALGGAAFASNPQWAIKSVKGRTAAGVFSNQQQLAVSSVGVRSNDPHNDPVMSFAFAGQSCPLDGNGGATCANVTVAPGKTATFRVTTRLTIAKGGFQGCSATVQPTPPGGNPPPPPPPAGQRGGPPLSCNPVNLLAAPGRAGSPKPSATLRAHLRGLIGMAITNETSALADLRARHTTAARGALLKSVAELSSMLIAGARYDLGDARHDVAAARGADQTVLTSYTESPTTAQLAQAQVILRQTIAEKKAAIKALE